MPHVRESAADLPAIAGLVWLLSIVGCGGTVASSPADTTTASAPVEPAIGEAAAQYQRGQELLKQHDRDGAIAAYREAIRLDPTEATYQIALGSAFYGKEDWDSAIAAYREAIRLQPTVEKPHLLLMATLVRKGDLASAIAAREDAVRLMPGKKGSLSHTLGQFLDLHTDMYDVELANAAYREAIQADPTEARYHWSLSGSLARKGDWAGALVEIREAMRLKPNDSIRSDLAEALGQNADWVAAEAEARAAVEAQPAVSNGHVSLGFARGGQGKIGEALASLEDALRLAPAAAAAHFYKGWVLARAGRKAEAAASYRKAVELMKRTIPGRRPTNWYVRTAEAAIRDLER